MHELSLATSIADIVQRHARGRRVTRVEVAVGHLRQAVPAALSFGFELVTMGTPLQGAELSIRQVPLRGRCRICGEEVEPEAWPLACPVCSSFELAISGGEELYVEALEVDDGPIGPSDPAAASGAGANERRLVTAGARRETWLARKWYPPFPELASGRPAVTSLVATSTSCRSRGA